MVVLRAAVTVGVLLFGLVMVTRPMAVFRFRSGAVDPEPRSNAQLRLIQVFGVVEVVLAGYLLSRLV